MRQFGTSPTSSDPRNFSHRRVRGLGFGEVIGSGRIASRGLGKESGLGLGVWGSGKRVCWFGVWVCLRVWGCMSHLQLQVLNSEPRGHFVLEEMLCCLFIKWGAGYFKARVPNPKLLPERRS